MSVRSDASQEAQRQKQEAAARAKAAAAARATSTAPLAVNRTGSDAAQEAQRQAAIAAGLFPDAPPPEPAPDEPAPVDNIPAEVVGTDAGQEQQRAAAEGIISGQTVTPTTKAVLDWASVLGAYGLPTDVVDELNRIWQTTDDLNQAIAIAQAYVRGTPWYAQTYPGIQSGINAGLFSDEQGYRAYKNQVDQVYSQYFGRLALPSEIQTHITTGQTVSQVATQFHADAIYGTLTDPLKALFTDAERHVIANEMAGIDSEQGQILNTQADLALKVNSLYKDFFGRAVTREEIGQLFQNGLTPQDVARQFATASNIAAMNPAVSALFTSDEIHQIALDKAGGITQNGQQLGALADVALQLNPLYHQYTGNGISRDEVNAFYSSGKTVDQASKEFAGNAYIQANKGDIQQAQGAFGEGGQFTDPQLKAFGEETAGLDTPMGQLLATQYQKALQRMHGVFKGVLASPALSLSTGKLAGSTAGAKPDIPA